MQIRGLMGIDTEQYSFHPCGNIKKNLKLSDRNYHCEQCGYTVDRDFNASLNLRDANVYTVE